MMKFAGEFLMSKTAPGIMLCISAVLALIVANTGLVDIYKTVLSQIFTVQIGNFEINKPILLWINDGLMAIFFLFIGLEVKRELVKGHLSTRENAMLPLIAAIGGAALPAIIYSYINWGNEDALRGWAIPAATDIAFALGILMLLGNRVPNTLKICLVAIAVIDDLFAVLIIAFFYTEQIVTDMLLLAAIGVGIAIIMNIRCVTSIFAYVLVALFVWACVLKSGIHPTLAGVVMGLIIPIKVKNKHDEAPLKVMEHVLHPWVNFFILPVFAFANAGVSLAGITFQTFLQPITLGIILGLFLGKQIGIMLITKLAVTLNICKLPRGVDWKQFYGMALLTGIGFTMSLFIGNLAFTGDEESAAVRLGVLSGSFLSAVCGIIVLMLTSPANKAILHHKD
jgi:NhaA family Na+:H+ antiporter